MKLHARSLSKSQASSVVDNRPRVVQKLQPHRAMLPETIAAHFEPAPPSLVRVTSRFERAAADMLRTHALLRRTDTKFLIHGDAIVLLLAGITNDYFLLPHGEQLFPRYRTIYPDTPDLLCVNEHRRGRRPRHKVRIRHYLDRQKTFFEIKTKRTSNVTDKVREERAFGDESIERADRRLITNHTGLPAGEFRPSLLMNFSRLTLLGKDSPERLTIDFCLTFDANDAPETLGNVAIVEVKQALLDRGTPIMLALRARGYLRQSASKYCLAIALEQGSESNVRTNRIRPALHALERIQR